VEIDRSDQDGQMEAPAHCSTNTNEPQTAGWAGQWDNTVKRTRMGQPVEEGPTGITREDAIVLQADPETVFRILLNLPGYTKLVASIGPFLMSMIPAGEGRYPDAHLQPGRPCDG
jgi:hypothetical protein